MKFERMMALGQTLSVWYTIQTHQVQTKEREKKVIK